MPTRTKLIEIKKDNVSSFSLKLFGKKRRVGISNEATIIIGFKMPSNHIKSSANFTDYWSAKYTIHCKISGLL